MGTTEKQEIKCNVNHPGNDLHINIIVLATWKSGLLMSICYYYGGCELLIGHYIHEEASCSSFKMTDWIPLIGGGGDRRG